MILRELEELNAAAWQQGKPFILHDGQVFRTREPSALRKEILCVALNTNWRRIFAEANQQKDEISICVEEMR